MASGSPSYFRMNGGRARLPAVPAKPRHRIRTPNATIFSLSSNQTLPKLHWLIPFEEMRFRCSPHMVQGNPDTNAMWQNVMVHGIEIRVQLTKISDWNSTSIQHKLRRIRGTATVGYDGIMSRYSAHVIAFVGELGAVSAAAPVSRAELVWNIERDNR